jgi:hypothetical protein
MCRTLIAGDLEFRLTLLDYSCSQMHMNRPSSSSIRSLFLDGPAGRLEALLNAGAANATHAALVCHPHPSFGGTLHNKVVFHVMKALNTFGFPVLRFNFRRIEPGRTRSWAGRSRRCSLSSRLAGQGIPLAHDLCGILVWPCCRITGGVRGYASKGNDCFGNPGRGDG